MNIDEIIYKWSDAAETALSAVKEKDYYKLRKAYRTGNKCFKDITLLIAQDTTKSKKSELKTLMNKWTNVCEILREWTKNIKTEIAERRRLKQKDNKLNKCYKGHPTKGKRLKLQAR